MILDTVCRKQMQITHKRTVTDAGFWRCHGQDTARLWLLPQAPSPYDFQTRTSGCRRPPTTTRQGLGHAANRDTDQAFTRAIACCALQTGHGDRRCLRFGTGHQPGKAGAHIADDTDARSARWRFSGALFRLAGNPGRQRCAGWSATQTECLGSPPAAAAHHNRIFPTFLAASPCSAWISSYKLNSNTSPTFTTTARVIWRHNSMSSLIRTSTGLVQMTACPSRLMRFNSTHFQHPP